MAHIKSRLSRLTGGIFIGGLALALSAACSSVETTEVTQLQDCYDNAITAVVYQTMALQQIGNLADNNFVNFESAADDLRLANYYLGQMADDCLLYASPEAIERLRPLFEVGLR